jgi:hypothetical protein
MAQTDQPATRQQMFEAMDRWAEAARNVLAEAEGEAKKVRASLRSFLTSDVTAYQVAEMAAAADMVEQLLKECRSAARKAAGMPQGLREAEDKARAEAFPFGQPRILDDEALAKRAVELAQLAVKADEASKQLDRAVDAYLQVIGKYRSGGQQGPGDGPHETGGSGRASRVAF